MADHAHDHAHQASGIYTHQSADRAGHLCLFESFQIGYWFNRHSLFSTLFHETFSLAEIDFLSSEFVRGFKTSIDIILLHR